MHLAGVQFKPGPNGTDAPYPLSLGIFKNTTGVSFDRPVTFFVGENGTGKSTLLRALCRKCGIFIWGGFENTNRAEDRFDDRLEIRWAGGPVPGSFFSSELFFNFSQIVEEWATDDPEMLNYFGGKSLVRQSHGQSMIAYFKARYRIKGLYFMDEPETALSPKSQLELLRVLEEMSRDGHAQFIVASHSPILLACPGARLYTFDDTAIRPIEYKQTGHYRLYRDFLTQTEKDNQ